jgi:RimJ/RimL family protein N-acetyltransferase
VPRRLAPPPEPLSDGVIRLEPLDERYGADFDRLVEDPEVVRNTRIPSKPPPGYGTEWLGRYVDAWREGTRAGFAILDGEDALVGFAAAVDFDSEGNQGEIGYVTVREARGRGIAGRALRLVTDWALDGAGLERIELHIAPENVASIRVAERCGYVREGMLRSLHFKEGERSDTVIYSLLPGDPR